MDLFIDYLSGNRLATTRQSIEDVSQFPQWPQTPFTQPLEGATPAAIVN